jgi:hypothetical protein
MTQTVPLINRMVATPLVAKVTDDLSESVPAIYAVVIEQVIVMSPDVLLKILIALPSENVALGIVIDPPEPTCTYLPTSPVANVYEPVFVPTAGMLLKPTAFVPSTVQPDKVPDDGVPSAPPFTTKAPEDPVFTPSAVTTPVPVVTVEGAAPAPPPTISELAVSAPELAQAEELEKYGTPPEVPATVSAKVPDVVIGEPATEISPPVKDCATEVTPPIEDATFTKSVSLQATTHFSPETIVTPAVGPAPRNTIEPVPALMTTYVLLLAGAVTFLVVAPLLAVHRIMACRA